MRLKIMGLALVAALSLCSGCSAVTAATSNNHALLEGQKLDEQVMGGVDALGTSANVLLEAAARSGVATRPQLLTAQRIRREMDAAHAAAYAAYTVGDAKTFSGRLAAVTDLNKQATALFNEVKK